MMDMYRLYKLTDEAEPFVSFRNLTDLYMNELWNIKATSTSNMDAVNKIKQYLLF